MITPPFVLRATPTEQEAWKLLDDGDSDKVLTDNKYKTPIVLDMAVYMRDADTLRKMIERGFEFTVESGLTAVINNDEKCLEVLVKENGLVHQDLPEYAARCGHLKLLKFLIENGCTVPDLFNNEQNYPDKIRNFLHKDIDKLHNLAELIFEKKQKFKDRDYILMCNVLKKGFKNPFMRRFILRKFKKLLCNANSR
jgi:hypothetical protein